ncbi:hypothetical protein BN1723_016600, partial [Verticillium longisporum]
GVEERWAMARSRTGCANCKRRKRKCDEARPGCQACEQRGVQCDGYNQTLRWNNGIASRGRLAGALVPELPAYPRPSAGARESREPFRPGPGGSPQTSETTPTEAHDDASADTDMILDAPLAVSSAPPSPYSSLGVTPTCPSMQPELFEQFLSSGLLRLYATETKTWIQPFFWGLAEQSEAFVYVCIAIQGYLSDKQRGLSVLSMERVDHALQSFRDEIASRAKTLHVATTCAGLLMCTLLLLQGRPWTFQIHLMADLYQLASEMPDTEHDEAKRHVLEVMGVMDLPNTVLGRSNPSIGIWKRLRETQDVWPAGRVGGIEVVSGLPRSLLDIFAGLLDNDPEYTERKFSRWPGDVGNHLQCHLWSSWRLAGILEVRRRQKLKRRSEGNHQPSTEIVLCQLMAAMDALYRASLIPRNEHLLVKNALAYPLTTAGLEVGLLRQHREWKATIDEIREHFMQRDDFNLIKVTFELIEEAWIDGSDYFDVGAAARRREVEVALF